MMRHQDRVGWLYAEFPKNIHLLEVYQWLYKTFRKKEKGKLEGKISWE